MDTNDKELFEAAITDEPIEIVSDVDTPEPVQSADDGISRDDKGRFASKAEDHPAPVVTNPEPQGRDEAHVPSWRLREERERAESAERRASEVEAKWQRQFQELQSRLPKPEPAPRPDLYEDADGFVRQGVRDEVQPMLDPIVQSMHYNNRLIASQVHGKDKVDTAVAEFDKLVASGELHPAEYQKVRNNPNPFAAAVDFIQQRTALQRVGNDPDAWFEKELEKRLADPQFASSQLQRIQQSVRNPSGNQSPANIVKLPPSIGKMPSSHSASDDTGDMSDGSLFAHAMR